MCTDKSTRVEAFLPLFLLSSISLSPAPPLSRLAARQSTQVTINTNINIHVINSNNNNNNNNNNGNSNNNNNNNNINNNIGNLCCAYIVV